jgi:hypothetical protein
MIMSSKARFWFRLAPNYQIPMFAILLLLAPLEANDWHHPLSLSGGDYWRQRIRVDIGNPSNRELAGYQVTLLTGSGPEEVDLEGIESQSIRVVDGSGIEVLFSLRRPDATTIRQGTIPEGSVLIIPVECSAFSSKTYWIYSDNPSAWKVPDFLRPPQLINGGVEEGYGSTPTGWKHDAGDFDHQASWVDEDPYSGEKCLKLQVTHGAPRSWISTRQKEIPVDGGQTYTLRGWVRAQDVSSGSMTGWYIHVATDTDPLAINRGLSAGAGTYGWKQVSWTFIAPPQAVHASVGTMLWGSGTAWFDEVTLEAHSSGDPTNLNVSISAPESLHLTEVGADPPWYDEDSEDEVEWNFRAPLELVNLGLEPSNFSAAVNLRRYSPRWRNMNLNSLRVVRHTTAVPFVASGEELLFEALVSARTREHYYLYFSSEAGIAPVTGEIDSILNGSNNRVFNPSFEMASGQQPTGWTIQKPSSMSSHGRASPGRFGNHSASFTVPHNLSGSIGWPGWIQNVPVESGKSYFFSGWVKLDDVRGMVRIHAHLRNRNGELVGSNPFLSIGTGLAGTCDWTRLSGTFTIPPGATIFQIHLTMNATGTLSHDGIMLLEGVTHPFQGAVEARTTESMPQVWTIPAVVKVFQDDHPPVRSESVRLVAAKGEFEPLQLAIRSQQPFPRVRVQVDPLIDRRGNRLEQFDVALVGFVPVAHTSDYHRASGWKSWQRPVVVGTPQKSGTLPSDFGAGSDGWIGWWPDPLVPVEEFSLSSNRSQPVWVTFWIPQGTPGGDYQGRVRFTQDGSTLAEKEITLHVWDFTLPEELSMTAIYDVRSGSRQQIPGQDPQDTYEELLELMADHRVAPNRVLPEPLFTFSGDSLIADYEAFDKAADFFLETLGFPQLYMPSAFYLFGWANPPAAKFGEAPYPGQHPYLSADRSQLRSQFKDRYQKALAHFWNHVKEKGWEDHFVLYISDEPHYREEGIIEQMQALCEMIHEVDPSIPIYSSVWNHVPEWEGFLDVWGIGHYGIVAKAEMENLLSAGDRLWFTTDGHMCIDTPYCAIERLLPHIAFHYNVEGYEFWGVDWLSDYDPWDFGWHSSVNLTLNPAKPTHSVIYPNGDGYLVYPGAAIGHHRAVPTIRLAQAREGLEDAEYLRLLTQKIAEARNAGLDVGEAEELLDSVAEMVSIPSASGRRSTSLLPSPELLFESRFRVGQMIEKLEHALKRRPGPTRESLRPGPR